jgi:predicted permease
MRALARFRSWLRAAFRRPLLNQEMTDELRLHVDLYAADLQRRGLPADEAARRARAELGSFDGQREAMRQSLGLRWLDELRGDVRYMFRLLRRSPGFAIVAILSVGLGIGANTAIFSLVDELLLKSLPVERPDRLFVVDNTGGKSGGNNAPPYPCYEILRDNNRHFAGIAMFDENEFAINIDGADEIVSGQRVSGNYFDVLGVRAALGRTLTPADDAPGSGGPDGPVVVISHALWNRRFGMSPTVLGKQIEIEKKAWTIVGVTPPEFFGLIVGGPVDLTIPVRQTDRNLSTRDSWWFSAVGRLLDGAAVETARAELDGLFQTYMTELNGRPPKVSDMFNRIELVPAVRGKHDVRRQFATPLTVVMTIAGLVLIIGCANVANLLLARASARQHEMRIRLAIGAGRARLIRQLVTEGLVIAGLGTVAGVFAAQWSAGALVQMIASTRQRIVLEPAFDIRVLSFAAAVATLTGLLCSLVPAFRATRTRRATTGDGGRATASTSSRRTGQTLVVVQVALSLALLSVAALFIRTLVKLETTETGFRRDDVVLMAVRTTLPRPTSDDRRAELARVGTMWGRLADRVRELPGASSVAIATLTPMDGADRGVRLMPVGGPALPAGERDTHLNQVTPGFFNTFEIKLLSGRLFQSSDTAASPRVAILSEMAARAAARAFGGSSPIGRHVKLTDGSEPYEVVGVVRDVLYESLRTAAGRMVYVPLSQPMDRVSGATLAVRTDRATGPLQPALRQSVRETMPGALTEQASTLEDQIAESLLQERLVSLLASVFGALALVLACIGLYGLLSYTVIRRTREFGIRLAIGAKHTTVLWLVLRETLALVTAGLAAGVLAVLVVGRYLENLLFGIGSSDPIAIGGAVAILLTIAMTAAYLPARRASHIHPTTVLRHE